MLTRKHTRVVGSFRCSSISAISFGGPATTRAPCTYVHIDAAQCFTGACPDDHALHIMYVTYHVHVACALVGHVGTIWPHGCTC